MKTEEQMIEEVLEMYYNEPANSRDSFRELKEAELIQLHHSLGQFIRNEFKLWRTEWDIVLDDRCVDVSPDHPDNKSMRIITEVWKRVQP